MAAALPLLALLPATILHDSAPWAFATLFYCLYMSCERVHMHRKDPRTLQQQITMHPALCHEGRFVMGILTAE